MELNNSAEGGSNGTTVTAANSGGASGDAFNSVVGTPTITFDNTQALGALSYKVVASTTAQQVVWSFTAVPQLYGRLYLYSSGAPSSATGLLRFTVGGSQTARIRYNADGTLTLADNGNAAEVSTVAALPTNAWMRIEYQITFTPGTGTCDLRTYNDPNSTTPTENLSSASLNALTNCDTVQIGSFNSATWTGWLDGLNVNTVDFPGPITRRPSGLLVAPSPAVRRAASW